MLMAKGKLIIHDPPLSPEEIEERRMAEDFAMTPLQRWNKMFTLMELALLFKKGPLKKPQGKGIVLKKKDQ